MKVFVVEDEKWYREFLSYHIELNPDVQVESFANSKDLYKRLSEKPDVICLDFTLTNDTGENVMKRILQDSPTTQVVIISGQEDISTAIDLLKQGAYDYIPKDDKTAQRVWNTLVKIKEHTDPQKENVESKRAAAIKYEEYDSLIGDSDTMKKVKALIDKAAQTNISVSIFGETGTGKEVVAKSIHCKSQLKGKFVAVNVAAIPSELLESELFGHEKGAFTGANSTRIGKFEEANHGTLFLDEIGEMSVNLQSKILRAIQEKEVTRLGGNKPIKLDIRIITATHKDLQLEVQEQRFRQDLYYRLMGMPLNLPPLRERGDDILQIAHSFVLSFCRANNIQQKKLDESAIKKLKYYAFPGNVRELKALIELAVVMSDGEMIKSGDIQLFPTTSSLENLLKQEKSLKEFTAMIIQHFLDKYDKNVIKVANALQIGKSTIYRMIQTNEVNV